MLLVADCNDKDIAKKINEKTKQDLVTRYHSDDTENVLYISMYLDSKFKLFPMLTEQKKECVKCSHHWAHKHNIKRKRKNQETEQTASKSESAIQLEHPQLKCSQKKFLMVLLDQEQKKMVVLQKLLKQSYKDMSLRNHLV